MNSNNNDKIILIAPTLGNKLGILFVTFFVMFILVSFASAFLSTVLNNGRDAFLLSSVLQSLLAFIFPAWLVARMCTVSSGGYLGFSTPVSFRQFAGILIFMILITPALNAVVFWNAGLSLPGFMSSAERMMRAWEDAAAKTTAMILGDTSVWGLVSGVLVVGCLTGLSEEMFFRAGLQKAISSCGINRHVAVWISACVFSAIHFQFFGFVPRLLLGALFGYVYAYTGSIWISAFAHSLNNSAVVVTAWLTARGLTDIDFDSIGVNGAESLWLVSSSLVLGIGFIFLLWNRFMRPPVSRTSN